MNKVLVLQTSISKFETFKEYPENELIDSIKSSNKKELIIFRDDPVFYKLEGKKGICNKEPTDIKIFVKKTSPQGNDSPKLTKTEQLMLYKEWYDKNKRQPHPCEIYENLNIYKFYEKCYKDKREVEEVDKILKDAIK